MTGEIGDVIKTELERISRNVLPVVDLPTPPPFVSDDCHTCHGQRWLRSDYLPGDPRFGQPIPCPDCRHIQQRKRLSKIEEKIRSLASIKGFSGYADRDFSNFYEQDYQIAALRRAKSFARDPVGFLTLSGGVATGKTHLLYAIAAELIHRGHTPLLTRSEDVLDAIRKSYERENDDNEDKETTSSVIETYKLAPILLIDELIRGGTGWAGETLFKILNDRYEYNRPTVIATNCRVSDLEPRLESRLWDQGQSVVVVLIGDDMRTKYRSLSPGSRVESYRKVVATKNDNVGGFYKNSYGIILVDPLCGSYPCMDDCLNPIHKDMRPDRLIDPEDIIL